MKAVNPAGKKLIDILAELARSEGGSSKIDNAKGTYMAVHVEWIGPLLLSIAHYGEQNGDLMRDPDMVFWHGPDGNWYPASIRNDYVGSYREAIVFDDATGAVKAFRPAEQYDEAVFAGKWMRNIREQQGLKG